MAQILKDFNPDGVGKVGEGFFSLPCSAEDARVVLLSVPWDVTVSYGAGCAAAPDELMLASSQIDLFCSSAPQAWREGIATLPVLAEFEAESKKMRPLAEQVIVHLEAGAEETDLVIAPKIDAINQASSRMCALVCEQATSWVESGKIVGLVGGDHSTPFGLIAALSKKYSSFGILHFDAHRDLRQAYEGFEYSHASIMFNVLRDFKQVERLVQVGVRDFCDGEQELAYRDERIISFTDAQIARRAFEGTTWAQQCDEIVDALPQNVYISFDIDGLEIGAAPHTGTPVPGGLSYNQAVYLLERVVASGRRIIGFDLVEVVPSPTDVVDLSVGVRVLYKLCGLSIKSNLK